MLIRSPADFGPIIRRRRRERKFSQYQLATQADVARQWLVGVEGGKQRVPVDLLMNTLHVLGYSLILRDETLVVGEPKSEATVVQPGSRQDEAEAQPPDITTALLPSAERSSSDEPEGRSRSYAEYQTTDLQAAGFTANTSQFYDIIYRPTIRRMAACIVSTEGPIFGDLLAHRIARFHRFARTASRIKSIIVEVVKDDFQTTMEDNRTVFWPESAGDLNVYPFRSGPNDVRDHEDIPAPELRSLALRFIDQAFTPEDAAVLMAKELGLARLNGKTRKRLETIALQLVQKTNPT